MLVISVSSTQIKEWKTWIPRVPIGDTNFFCRICVCQFTSNLKMLRVVGISNQLLQVSLVTQKGNKFFLVLIYFWRLVCWNSRPIVPKLGSNVPSEIQELTVNFVLKGKISDKRSSAWKLTLYITLNTWLFTNKTLVYMTSSSIKIWTFWTAHKTKFNSYSSKPSSKQSFVK